jgi:hypothetical protein
VSDALGSLGESIFGGGEESVVDRTGLSLGKLSAAQALAGNSLDVQNWARVQTTHSGGMLGDDWTSYADFYTKANSSVTSLFSLVYKNLSSSLVELSKQLGTNTQDVLNYVFADTKINLQNMSSDEINKAISEYISNISDTAVDKLFGSMLKDYQKLNEGLLETAVRLITDKAVIAEYLEMTNQKFTGTIPAAIKFSETLITIAGSLDKLTDAMQTYYDAFFSDSERQAKLKEQLQSAMGQYGYDLPGTRAGYRALVESLNLTTDAGQAAYVALMQMSKGADEYYKYLEQAKASATANIKPENYSTNLEYQRALAGLQSFDNGGMSVGPESGYLAKMHGTELVISPRKGYPATVKGEGNAELIAEVKALREEVASMNRNGTANTFKTANNTEYLETWDAKGLPT